MAMWDSGCKGCVVSIIVGVVSRVRMMARDITQRIRVWLAQKGITIRLGESSRGMQIDVEAADLSQNIIC